MAVRREHFDDKQAVRLLPFPAKYCESAAHIAVAAWLDADLLRRDQPGRHGRPCPEPQHTASSSSVSAVMR